MNDPPEPSRMDRLRAVEQWLSWHLDRTRAELGRLERAADQARDEADTAERRRAALAGWTVQTGGARWTIHRGECVYRNDRRCRPVSPAEARRLVDSGEAGACRSCGAEGIDAPA